MTLTVGSLFSGIGGLELGLERAGMEVKWQVEIDEFCNRVLEKHWPDVERHRDVREVGAHNLVPVDLICGGFPCQPHSLAGQRKGKNDERHLWPEYRRIVDELRPTWVLGENVPGIRTTALDDIILDLEGMGYTVGTFDIPACAVGAPHLRHRFFIVAHAEHSGPSLTGGRDESQRALGGPVHASREDVAHADGAGRQEQRGAVAVGQEQRPAECGGAAVADPEGFGWREGWPESGRGGKADAGSAGREVVDADSRRCEQRDTAECCIPKSDAHGWWETGPGLGDTLDGLPGWLARYWGPDWECGVPRVTSDATARVAKLKALGNAVVPQVAEYIGRLIVAADAKERKAS